MGETCYALWVYYPPENSWILMGSITTWEGVKNSELETHPRKVAMPDKIDAVKNILFIEDDDVALEYLFYQDHRTLPFSNQTRIEVTVRDRDGQNRLFMFAWQLFESSAGHYLHFCQGVHVWD
jgi:hypothetical protein